MTTPSSRIDLTSQSVPHLSLPFLCRIFLILDKLKIEMTKDSLHHAGKTGSIAIEKTCIMLLRMGSIPVWRISMEIISTDITSTSLVVPIRAYLSIKLPRYMSTSQKGTSSQTNTWNYVKTTLNH